MDITKMKKWLNDHKEEIGIIGWRLMNPFTHIDPKKDYEV